VSVGDVARTLMSAGARLVSTLLRRFAMHPRRVETSLDLADMSVRSTKTQDTFDNLPEFDVV